MTRFLKTSYLGLVNADRIWRIRGASDETTRGQNRAMFDDGSDLTLYDSFEEIEKALLPVVAATPGYTALSYYVDDGGGEPWVDRRPVTAWRVDKDVTLPVTPDDNDMETSLNCIGWGVLVPDGQVIQPYLAAFDDEQTWRAKMAKNAEARRKSHKPKLESASARSSN